MLQRLMVQLVRLGDAASSHTILDRNQLRRVLTQERARTDRTGRPFSLLTFTSIERPASVDDFRPLLKALRRRLRCTDELGFFAPDCLGVVLPETPAVGAWKVADDVLATESWKARPTRCEVYTYPSDDPDLPAASSAETCQPSTDRPVQPMELLFIQRMPFWKRGLDIVGAIAGLLLFSPILLIGGIGIKLTSPGPIIFRQRRSGAGNRPFLMYKLRTMHVDAEARRRELLSANEQDGPAFKIRNDPRVTRWGRFLRRTSIDELPQFWNVLKGEMSLVGPRPLPCDESDNCTPWQKNRLDVKPGLTCIWQVRGRSQVSFDEWVRMDREYLRSVSVWTDLKLIMKTIYVVLLRKGAC